MRAFLGVLLGLAVIAPLACRAGSTCPTTPCPLDTAYFSSPCGFKGVTSTCSGFAGFDPNACSSANCGVAVKGMRAETCTVSVTYGDGKSASATITFADGDDCCPGVRGYQGQLTPAATCVKDAGADSATDAAADATNADADAGSDQ